MSTPNDPTIDSARNKSGPKILADEIHVRAINAAQVYRRSEADLIDALQLVDDHRVFIQRGHSSLFAYVIAELGLGESLAYSLITIARKAREIPELKRHIRDGSLTLTNARQIVPHLTPENASEWITKASALPSRKLEREIVAIHPRAATVEKATYVTPARIELKIGLSESAMLRLRRAQDLLSQARKRPVSLEETVDALTEEFLRRTDPVSKAKRHQVRKGCSQLNKENPNTPIRKLAARRVHPTREPLSAAILHHVNLRDERQCAHILTDGRRCNQSRWLEIHHKTPVHEGGSNDPANLITLCSSHHRHWHQLREERLKQT
jgi:hypothetical protein